MFGVSAAALIFTTPALAQEQPAPPADDQTTEVAPAASIEPTNQPAQPAAGDEIVVTGSRIRRTEATSASPLQIIDPTIGQRQGQLDTSEMINGSPIVAGSSQITSAISTNAVTNGGPGASTVSLRGLGAERTLVLLNSRRAGPAGTRGAVASFDLNVLPQSIVKSIEILKDGASSIYGSDAVAGVVNILTKTDTHGLELNGFGTVPFKKGGESFELSATWGKEFSRGHILISADYYKKAMLRRKDREYLGCPEDYIFRSDGKTRADLIDPRTGKPWCNGTVWGHVWTYGAYNLPDTTLTLLQYNYAGDNLQNFIPGPRPATGPGELVVAPGWFPVGYTLDPNSPAASSVFNQYHPFEQKSSVSPKTDRKTLYVDGHFDLTDNIAIYGEGIFNQRKDFNDSYTQIYNFGYAAAAPFAGDPFPGFYNPTPFCTTADEYYASYCYGIVLSPTGLVDDVDNSTDVKYYRAVAGVRGKLPFGDWEFDTFGQYSKSDGKYKYTQVLLDAINTQNYKYGSCVGTFTPISNRPCIDINWVDPAFMRGELTQAQRDFLFGTEVGRTKYVQKFVEASVNGTLLHLPAGPVGLALGATARRDSIDDMPGNITHALIPGGDPNNPADFVDNGFANPISSGPTKGFSVTKEAFGEINIPIFKNAPFARSFDVSAAARVTNVNATRSSDGFSSASKGNWTYKGLVNWQVTDWVRLRSTYGTSYRAPALFEQFLGAQTNSSRQSRVDPCVNWGSSTSPLITERVKTNCAADGIDPDHTGAGISATIFSSGGIGTVKPETSKALTASVIFTPRFAALPNTRIDLTIDYFNIKVRGEITQLGAFNILYGCYNSVDFPTEPLCALFERGQDGDPQNVRNIFDKFINVNRQENKGFDFTLRAKQGLGHLGSFTFLGQATYQKKDNITLFNGTVDNLNGEVGDPKLTADLNLSWDLPSDTSLFWGIDYVGKTSNKKQFIRDNGGLCNINAETASIYGDYCYVVNTKPVFYHNVSVTQKLMGDRFEATLGVSNLFNTRPPRISVAAVSSLGQAPFVSNYDWLGRRVFVALKARIK
ncbi:MAG: TonB-dependent receptor [Sphingomicrobium sp.]